MITQGQFSLAGASIHWLTPQQYRASLPLALIINVLFALLPEILRQRLTMLIRDSGKVACD